ncbi:class I SAM-dependent methyltransferase [Altererythrobacter fulvus]|uniref:class I SAM-dependent methyltransferase n=1 Tax=Caenibius fulvus TaxID=2126012 RepID=UPI003015FB7A
MTDTGDDAFENFKAGYANLTRDEIQQDMDRRYETGDAYPNPSYWIHAHHRSLETQFVELIGNRADGKDVLEIGCGSGGIAAHHLKAARHILATDLSSAAIGIARDFFKEQTNTEFMQIGVEDIGQLGRKFDVIVSKEVIEHLIDPTVMLNLAFETLNPGGCFILSTPNKDSLHLRVNRLFGREDFVCSGDHIREFTYKEMQDLLASAGFVQEAAVGVTLLPYHYVDGVFPDTIRNAEDYNEEFNEMLQELGRLAGPEYAFGYIIRCRKPYDVLSR